jgi:hypothetical protein
VAASLSHVATNAPLQTQQQATTGQELAVAVFVMECNLSAARGCRAAESLLGLPANVLEQVARSLPGNSKRNFRAACRELRGMANATTDFLRVCVNERCVPLRAFPTLTPSSLGPTPQMVLSGLQFGFIRACHDQCLGHFLQIVHDVAHDSLMGYYKGSFASH